MLKGPLTDYLWMIVAALVILFTVAKLGLIKLQEQWDKLPDIYFMSLRNMHKHAIERFDSKHARRYYRISNNINIFFYMTLLSILLLYIFIIYVV